MTPSSSSSSDSEAEAPAPAKQQKGSAKKPTPKEPFRRVAKTRADVSGGPADNSFHGQVLSILLHSRSSLQSLGTLRDQHQLYLQGGFDEWGRQANADLSKVQGKDFRHEKTKKKRGSYKGGPINTSVNSFKFNDDGEE